MLFGTHDRLPEPVLLAMRRGVAPDLPAVAGWVLEHEQKAFGAMLERLQSVSPPGAVELIRNGADLLVQEAHGAHTLLKHIGRDADFLRRRQALDAREAGSSVMPDRSSFLSLDEAERAVAAALHDGDANIQRWLTTAADKTFLLKTSLREPAGLLVNAYGQVVTAQQAVLQLIRRPDGSFRIHSAYVGS